MAARTCDPGPLETGAGSSQPELQRETVLAGFVSTLTDARVIREEGSPAENTSS